MKYRPINLKAKLGSFSDQMYVVPRGVEHRPHVEKECHVLLIEPEGTVNTGDAGGELTAREGQI